MKKIFVCMLLGVCLLFASCIREDNDDCPVTGTARVKLTYFSYDPGVADRFADEVTRTEIFAFGGDGVFAGCFADETGPFKNGYVRELSLPAGDYKLVAWCNGGDDYYRLSGLVPGVTTYNEAMLQLRAVEDGAQAQNGVVEHHPVTLLHGTTAGYSLHVEAGETSTDSIDLMKMTHEVSVRLRWKNHDGIYCAFKGHEERVHVRLADKNGDFDFDGNLLRRRFLSYVPQYSYPEEFPVDHATVRADIRTMRLTAEGSNALILIDEVRPDGTSEVVYSVSLMELIRLTGHYGTQAVIDRTNDFKVDVDFYCHDDTHPFGDSYGAFTIWINGWKVIDMTTGI